MKTVQKSQVRSVPLSTACCIGIFAAVASSCTYRGPEDMGPPSSTKKETTVAPQTQITRLDLKDAGIQHPQADTSQTHQTETKPTTNENKTPEQPPQSGLRAMIKSFMSKFSWKQKNVNPEIPQTVVTNQETPASALNANSANMNSMQPVAKPLATVSTTSTKTSQTQAPQSPVKPLSIPGRISLNENDHSSTATPMALPDIPTSKKENSGFSGFFSKFFGKKAESSNPQGTPVQQTKPSEPSATSSDFTKGLHTETLAALGPRPASIEEKSKEPIHYCFMVTYRHKSTPGHSDDETCSQHKNLLKLKNEMINMKSLCVRVNGRPVAYHSVKGKPHEVLIGPVAGPKSKITAQYCVGKETCDEDCTVPKDDFMAALSGTTDTDDDTPTTQMAQWDPGDSSNSAVSKVNMAGEINRTLADFSDKSNSANSDGEAVFQGWISDTEAGVPACEGTRKGAS